MNPTRNARLDRHGFVSMGDSLLVRDDGTKDGHGESFPMRGLFDLDSFRALTVTHLVPDVWSQYKDGGLGPEDVQAIISKMEQDDPDWEDASFAALCRLVRPLMDELPADVVAIDLDASGKVVRTSTDPALSPAWSTYYPSVAEYQLRRPVATLLRSQLAVTERFRGGSADKVVCLLDDRTMVFKYRGEACLYGGVWGEIQILSQLPAGHPHFLTLEALVLEEISGLGVVGFTMRYVASPSLDRWDPSRQFKLRWLRELMAIVDELNLEYGIMHQDIADRNLLIDPDTGSLVLIDFGYANGIGHGDHGRGYRGEMPGRDDVKGVVILAYYLVTRDPRYSQYYLDQVDEADVLDVDKWTSAAAANHAVLDHPPAVFHAEVTAWAARRRAAPPLTHYTQAPKHLHLPPPPVPPRDVVTHVDDSSGAVTERNLITAHGLRADRIAAGRPVLRWERPPASKVDKSRLLLATGRYADEEPAADGPGLAVPDSKRGFPQPPVPVAVEGGESGGDKRPQGVDANGTSKKRRRRG